MLSRRSGIRFLSSFIDMLIPASPAHTHNSSVGQRESSFTFTKRITNFFELQSNTVADPSFSIVTLALSLAGLPLQSVNVCLEQDTINKAVAASNIKVFIGFFSGLTNYILRTLHAYLPGKFMPSFLLMGKAFHVVF